MLSFPSLCNIMSLHFSKTYNNWKELYKSMLLYNFGRNNIQTYRFLVQVLSKRKQGFKWLSKKNNIKCSTFFVCLLKHFYSIVSLLKGSSVHNTTGVICLKELPILRYTLWIIVIEFYTYVFWWKIFFFMSEIWHIIHWDRLFPNITFHRRIHAYL